MRNQKELNEDIVEIEKLIKEKETQMFELNKQYIKTEKIKGNLCIMQAGAKEELNMLQTAEQKAAKNENTIN